MKLGIIQQEMSSLLEIQKITIEDWESGKRELKKIKNNIDKLTLMLNDNNDK